jgi:hypothetical protein
MRPTENQRAPSRGSRSQTRSSSERSRPPSASQPHAPLRNGEAAEFERRCDIKHTAEPLFEGAEQSFLGGYTEHLVMAMVREAVAGANSHDVADFSPLPSTSAVDFDDTRPRHHAKAGVL